MKNKRKLTILLIFTLFTFLIPSFSNSSALRYSDSVTLSNVDASFIGESYKDLAGQTVRDLGDINGDGLNDIIIGAPSWTNERGEYQTGKVYIIFGMKQGWIMDKKLKKIEFQITGEKGFINDPSGGGNVQWGDMVGARIGAGGDLNNDGYDDFILGIGPHYKGGKLAIFFGKSLWSPATLTVKDADCIIVGSGNVQIDPNFISDFGDVNGDGYDDFLTTAMIENEIYKRDEWPVLFYGKESWGSESLITDGDVQFNLDVDSFKINRIGDALNIIGDVNGDFLDDIAIGTEIIWTINRTVMHDAGEVFLIFGNEHRFSRVFNISLAKSSIQGDLSTENIARWVSGAGDVNGDGYSDFVIGTPTIDGKGKINLFFGRKDGWSLKMSILSSNVTFYGRTEDDVGEDYNIGHGNVDGDQFEDIVIGAKRSNYDESIGNGKAYLVLGKAEGWKKEFHLKSSDVIFKGEELNDCAGSSVTISGDINGDGNGDLIIGAKNSIKTSIGGDRGKGQVYVIFPKFNSRPLAVDSIKAYIDNDFDYPLEKVTYDECVTIQLSGLDNNPKQTDVAFAWISIKDTDNEGLFLRLIETDKSSGHFVGKFIVMERTDEDYNLIGANPGDVIRIASTLNPSVFVEIKVVSFDYSPRFQVDVAEVGENYHVEYSTFGNEVKSMEMNTDAHWLSLDSQRKELFGTPSISDLGKKIVTVTFRDEEGDTYQHEYSLHVNRRPINVSIISPKDGLVVNPEDNREIELVGYGEDPDTADQLVFIWYDGSTEIAQGNSANFTFSPGSHTIQLKVEDGKTYVTDEVFITIKKPANIQMIAKSTTEVMLTSSILIPISVLSTIGFLSTEVGKYKTALLLTPLYSKTRKEKLLDNFTRGKIYQYIIDHPGVHYNQILRDLELNNGTAAFHLNKLESMDYVTSNNDGFKRRFYPSGKAVTFKTSKFERIISTLRKNPGLTQKDLSKELDIPISTMNHYFSKMKKAGIIITIKEGKNVLCYLSEEDEDWSV